jgi:2-phosphosulfolactate phosphatase
VIAEATVRYLRRGADEVTVVAMGHGGIAPSQEDDACARHVAARLTGVTTDAAALVASLWEHEDPNWPDWFPRRDAELACQVDRFDFALPVTREDGLFVARPAWSHG